jgi:S1-C subfamily serine protease
MKNKKTRIWIVISIVLLIISACTIPGITADSMTAEETEVAEADIAVQEENLSETSTSTIIIPDEVLLEDALIQLYKDVSPGVVSIQVYTQNSSAVGSGFVVDKDGHIVTNYHVVGDALQIEVHFPSGLKVYGEVIGVDLDSDIAVIQVDVDPEELMPLTIGDSDQMHVGQTVVAIGNPYGLSGTMTVGIISARGRSMESIRQTESGQYFSTGDMIQTDATINPGNSGGPLLNLNGEVIGINRAIQTDTSSLTGLSSYTGIGFAVSSNILKLVLPSLIEEGTYAYPYLGLSSYESLTLVQAEYLGLSQANGAYVVEVIEGGPADEAGIQAGSQATDYQGLFTGGDLIIAVDGVDVLQFSDLLSYMMLNKAPGDEMVVTVLRDGAQMDFTVVLGERSDNMK